MFNFTFPEERDVILDNLQKLLFPKEDHRNLNGDLHETSAWRTLLLSEAQQPVVVAWVSCEPSFKECQVEDGAVEVDKLEQITLQSQRVVVVRLGSEKLEDVTFDYYHNILAGFN